MSTVPFSRSRSISLEKTLPQNLDAERSVLGAILLDNEALKIAMRFLKANDFAHVSNSSLSLNGKIYLAMLRLYEDGKPIEPLTLIEHLQARDDFAALIAGLADGIPRVSNVEHYCKLVREKSLLRQLAHKTQDIQERALEGNVRPDELITDLELFTKECTGIGRLTHSPVDVQDLLTMDLPEREYILVPIFPTKGIAELYAWRGSGKTFVALDIAHSVASGMPNCFGANGVWEIPKARPVLYVDGEMNREDLQERLQQIARAHGTPASKGFLRFIASDLEDKIPPQIITSDGRRRIEDHLRGGELLILDNLSSLQSTGSERETEEWAVTQEWLLALRRAGYHTMFLHHAGKDGKQRGTSNREDIVNLVITLRRPADYTQEDGLRCEVYLEKIRGRAIGVAVQPFELKLQTDERNAVVWLRRPLKQIIAKRAFEMLAAGMRPNDIADDLHLSRYQVYRLKKKFDADPLAPAEE